MRIKVKTWMNTFLIILLFGASIQVAHADSSEELDSLDNIMLSAGQNPQINTSGNYVEGQIFVRYKSEALANTDRKEQIQSALNEQINPRFTKDMDNIGIDGVQFVVLPSDVSVENALTVYRNDSNVLWAQPNYVYYALSTPNDIYYNQQWGLHNTGQFVNDRSGTPLADISAPSAWDFFTGPAGSDTVTIAVLDSGIDADHPDLISNIYNNPGEMGVDSQGRDKRFNEIDDDGDWKRDNWRGWNFVDGTNNITDGYDHGTYVSGVLGATGNNNIGISGVNQRVKILPLKILKGSNEGFTKLWATDFEISQSFEYAYAHNIKIVSCSWGANGIPNDEYVKNFSNYPDTRKEVPPIFLS